MEASQLAELKVTKEEIKEEKNSRQNLNLVVRRVAPSFNDSGISAESCGSQDSFEVDLKTEKKKKKKLGESENSQLDLKFKR